MVDCKVRLCGVQPVGKKVLEERDFAMEANWARGKSENIYKESRFSLQLTGRVISAHTSETY